MKIACISDKGSKSALAEDLRVKTQALITAKGHSIRTVELDRDEISACTGCLQCWSTQTGECVSREPLAELTRDKLDCDLVMYLTPIVFGSCNSTIKNAVDRSELLFINKKRAQIIIGYGEQSDDEERSTFVDLIDRHRGRADVVHPDKKETITVFVTHHGQSKNERAISR
jgi:multimeric flavodoxin WrbA